MSVDSGVNEAEATDPRSFDAPAVRSPLLKPHVATFEEALSLNRKDSGSWKPTPSVMRQAFIRWASPVPRTRAKSDDFDFELVIDDFDSDVQNHQHVITTVDHDAKGSKFEIEQLISCPGTLPNPMSPDEREAAIRYLRPTATYEMLAQVPREFLERSTEASQQLRRKLVRGATVVFVTAGYPGKRFIFERIAALGVKAVIIDHPHSWSRVLVEEGIVAKFLPIDMMQSGEGVFGQAKAEIRDLGKDRVTGTVDAIVTFVELAVPLVARLCEEFGLPGFRPNSVDAARDKYRTRGLLEAANLPTPRIALIKGEEDLVNAAAIVGFPAVLKPNTGAASLCVRKVYSFEELQKFYLQIVSQLELLIFSSGAVSSNSDRSTDRSRGICSNKPLKMHILLEEYLDGDEVDVDVVMSDGHWYYAAVSDNGPTREPYFNETWAVSPSMMSKDKQTLLRELAVNSLRALGFTTGVFHVECKFTRSGPHLIEVNARMGGGPVRECNRLVWGVDLVEETIFCALGIPLRPSVPDKPLTCIGYTFLTAPFSCKIESTACIENLPNRRDVVYAQTLVNVGDEVVGSDNDLPTWLCELVVSDQSSAGALRKLNLIQEDMRVNCSLLG